MYVDEQTTILWDEVDKHQTGGGKDWIGNTIRRYLKVKLGNARKKLLISLQSRGLNK